MTRWYKVSSWEDKPEPVEVLKHTDKTVTVATEWFGKWTASTRPISSSATHYWPSWAEARRAIIDREKARRESLSDAMRRSAEAVRLALELPEEEPK